jgi:hypothetical protein
MPQRKFRMILSSRNVQTTAYPRSQKETVATESKCCGVNRNPLKGWRKEMCCTGAEWVEVFKNVNGPDCCQSRLKMVQNRADGVSGKIDRKYNHNYRQYLKKRCRIADFDVKMGSTDYTFNRGVIGTKSCCMADCSNNTNPVSTYKRSNWRFRRQGAVDNDINIAKIKYETKNICLNCAGIAGGDCDCARRPQYPPQDPAYNPQNYNKN